MTAISGRSDSVTLDKNRLPELCVGVRGVGGGGGQCTLSQLITITLDFTKNSVAYVIRVLISHQLSMPSDQINVMVY